MNNVVAMRILLACSNKKFYNDFISCVSDLIYNTELLSLANFTQHIKANRLEHSINVAYYSFVICKFFSFNYRSAARAGLLHDFYLYNWHKNKQPEGYHAKAHPIIALRNAEKITKLNNIEKDIIRHHMWPLTLIPPTHKESIIVSFVDKGCALCEMVNSLFTKK
jgi:uncharacterized protein